MSKRTLTPADIEVLKAVFATKDDLDHKLEQLSKDVGQIKKDIKVIKKSVNLTLKYVDDQDKDIKKRVEKLESVVASL
jgi:peptidoglycan hydrolase CwlO-like protein